MKNTSTIPNELYYLDENFSVRSLRKYQLKEILAAHNIPYLQGITRNDLINLFKKHIEAKREEILADYNKQHSAEQTEELGRGHRAIHKPVKFVNELEHYYGPPKKDKDGFAIPAKPKRVRFNPEDSFDDSEIEPSLPLDHTKIKVKKEITTLKKPAPPKKPSTTTTTNQTQKSSEKAVRHFNPEDSFASSGEDDDDENSEIHKDEEMSYSTIEQTEEQEEKTIDQTEQDEDDEDPDYDADADFTDDEDDDLGDVEREELVMLYKDQSVPAESLITSAYPIKTRAQRLNEAKQKYALWINRLKQLGFFACVIYTMVALLALNITANARQKNGYCSNQETMVHKNVSSWVSLLPSPCIPCPDHGTCVDGELQCDPLYERKTPFYNPYNIFPIADDCIHNSVLGRYVAKVERKIKRQLAVKQGEIACAHLLAHADSATCIPVPTARVLVKDLLTDIKTTVEPYLPADKTEEIMIIALSAVLEDPQVHYWEIDDKKYLGTDVVEYSALCQVKRLYKGIPFKVKMYIMLVTSILSAIFGASRDYKKNLKYQEKINHLVKSTLNQLKDQHEKHMQDPILHPSPTLPVSQLRMAIVDVNNKKTIEDWHRVVEKIESNPHVRKSFKEVRGDPVEHWELIV